MFKKHYDIIFAAKSKTGVTVLLSEVKAFCQRGNRNVAQAVFICP